MTSLSISSSCSGRRVGPTSSLMCAAGRAPVRVRVVCLGAVANRVSSAFMHAHVWRLLCQLLSECGYTVGCNGHSGIARTKSDVLRAFATRNTKWSLFLIEMGSEAQPGIDARPGDFFAAVQAVLREMSLRQILVPTVAVQEEKATDSIVRTMRLGVVDAVLPPFTKSKFRSLLRCEAAFPTRSALFHTNRAVQPLDASAGTSSSPRTCVGLARSPRHCTRASRCSRHI